MYFKEQGVSRDDEQAYKWLALAAATYTAKAELDEAGRARDSAAARMTPAQLAEAQKLTQEWKSNRRGGGEYEPLTSPQ